MGKSSFANVKDETGTIQFYVDKTDLNEEVFKINAEKVLKLPKKPIEKNNTN